MKYFIDISYIFLTFIFLFFAKKYLSMDFYIIFVAYLILLSIIPFIAKKFLNKDVYGLIKYLGILFAIILIPLLSVFLLFGVFLYYENIHANIAIATLVFLAILYLILPIIVTTLAIVQKWSKYLDWFFNQLLTLGLILLLFIIAFIYLWSNLPFYNFLDFIYPPVISIAPCYFITYITIVINKIIAKCKL